MLQRKTLHGFVNHPRGAGRTTQSFIRTFRYLQPSETRETETHLSYGSDLCSRLIARSTPTCQSALAAFKQNSEAAKREIKAGLCAEGDYRERTIQIQGQLKVLISPHINPRIQREPRQTQGETCKVHPEKTQEDHRNWILDLVSVRHLQSLTEYWHIFFPFYQATLVGTSIKHAHIISSTRWLSTVGLSCSELNFYRWI